MGPKRKHRRRQRKREQARGLFVGTAERWWLNACINWLSSSYFTMDFYARGYLAAAQHLSRAATQRRTNLILDAVIYPLIFLWRHYLEVRLKEIIISARALVGEPQSPTLGHNLGVLWKRARQLIKRGLNAGDQVLARADRLFKEFAQVDPSSQAFRYTEDTGGSRTLPGVTHINVYNLAKEMKWLSNFLEGVSIEISVYLREIPNDNH